MTYEEAIEAAVKEGAIRAYRLSDSTAYVYRYQDGHFQGRTLSGDSETGEWKLLDYWVTLGFRREHNGWYEVEWLPWQAQLIESEEAEKNPGYARVALRQCYTCKEVKPETAFEREGLGQYDQRKWECNECFNQRMKEVGQYQQSGGQRSGDYLDKETMASPPPPKGEI